MAPRRAGPAVPDRGGAEAASPAGRPGGVRQDDVLAVAAALRWERPDLTAQLADHVLAAADSAGDRDSWLEAAGWGVHARSAIGDGRAVAATALEGLRRWGPSALALPPAHRLRVELALVAIGTGQIDRARGLIAPVAAADSPLLRADAHTALARCAVEDDPGDVSLALQTARAAWAEVAAPDSNLGLAVVELVAAAAHRRAGRAVESAAAATAGLTRLRDRSGNAGALVSGPSVHLAAALTTEWISALLDNGRVDEAQDGCEPLFGWLGEPLRPCRQLARLRLTVARAVAPGVPTQATADALARAAQDAADSDSPELEVVSRSALATLLQQLGQPEAASTSTRLAELAGRRDRHRDRLFRAVLGAATVPGAEALTLGDGSALASGRRLPTRLGRVLSGLVQPTVSEAPEPAEPGQQSPGRTTGAPVSVPEQAGSPERLAGHAVRGGPSRNGAGRHDRAPEEPLATGRGDPAPPGGDPRSADLVAAPGDTPTIAADLPRAPADMPEPIAVSGAAGQWPWADLPARHEQGTHAEEVRPADGQPGAVTPLADAVAAAGGPGDGAGAGTSDRGIERLGWPWVGPVGGSPIGDQLAARLRASRDAAGADDRSDGRSDGRLDGNEQDDLATAAPDRRAVGEVRAGSPAGRSPTSDLAADRPTDSPPGEVPTRRPRADSAAASGSGELAHAPAVGAVHDAPRSMADRGRVDSVWVEPGPAHSRGPGADDGPPGVPAVPRTGAPTALDGRAAGRSTDGGVPAQPFPAQFPVQQVSAPQFPVQQVSAPQFPAPQVVAQQVLAGHGLAGHGLAKHAPARYGGRGSAPVGNGRWGASSAALDGAAHPDQPQGGRSHRDDPWLTGSWTTAGRGASHGADGPRIDDPGIDPFPPAAIGFGDAGSPGWLPGADTPATASGADPLGSGSTRTGTPRTSPAQGLGDHTEWCSIAVDIVRDGRRFAGPRVAAVLRTVVARLHLRLPVDVRIDTDDRDCIVVRFPDTGRASAATWMHHTLPELLDGLTLDADLARLHLRSVVWGEAGPVGAQLLVRLDQALPARRSAAPLPGEHAAAPVPAGRFAVLRAGTEGIEDAEGAEGVEGAGWVPCGCPVELPASATGTAGRPAAADAASTPTAPSGFAVPEPAAVPDPTARPEPAGAPNPIARRAPAVASEPAAAPAPPGGAGAVAEPRGAAPAGAPAAVALPGVAPPGVASATAGRRSIGRHHAVGRAPFRPPDGFGELGAGGGRRRRDTASTAGPGPNVDSGRPAPAAPAPTPAAPAPVPPAPVPQASPASLPPTPASAAASSPTPASPAPHPAAATSSVATSPAPTSPAPLPTTSTPPRSPSPAAAPSAPLPPASPAPAPARPAPATPAAPTVDTAADPTPAPGSPATGGPVPDGLGMADLLAGALAAYRGI